MTASRRFLTLTKILPSTLVVALALLCQFYDPQFRARLRDNAFDQMQTLAPRSYQDDLPIRVIAIDDASLARIGQWPWPRTIFAEMVDRLAVMGARAVAFDVVFSEPDRTSPEFVASRWPEQRVLRNMLLALPAHDLALAQSVSRLPTALGFLVDSVTPSPVLPPLKSGFLAFGGDARDWLPNYAGGLSSLPLLTAVAAGSGGVSLEPGLDGVVRALPLIYRIGDTLYPGLDLDALRLFSGASNLAVNVTDAATAPRGAIAGIQGINLASLAFLPTAPDGRIWLHFRRLTEQRYISAKDFLAGQVDPAQVKEHLVYIGVTAKGLGDNVYSPLGELIPGIEAHVQLAEQLLTGSYLLRPAWENDAFVALMLGVWLVLGVLLHRFRPVWSVFALCLVLTGVFGAAFWLFFSRQTLLDPLFPSLAVCALFLAMVVPSYMRTEREQRWIRNAFSRYVSPNRVKHLQANPEHLELGGIYRECSFVMTDLEGFTALMEKHASGELSALLNEYLDGMIQIAFRHDGTLDRIVGDAVAVMFSAPLEQADHARRALACALDMDAFAEAFRLRCIDQGIAFGRTRIGVNTGTVLVGNFGGKAMLDYRALGDAINTAARLESVNSQLGTRICVSGTTVAQCPDFVGRPGGQLVLKGKQNAVATFEPLTSPDQAHLAAYCAAYALMEAESPQAAAAFAQLASDYPADALAAYHAKRLAAGEIGCRVVMKSK